MSEHTSAAAEPEIVEAVQRVENRYGVGGLEQLIALAEEHLGTARAAAEQLAELDRD